MSKYSTFQRSELILTPSIVLDTIVLIILFSRRGSYCCSARGGVAAEGTSCMRQKNVENSITLRDPYQKCLLKPWKISLFLSGPKKMLDFVSIRFFFFERTRPAAMKPACSFTSLLEMRYGRESEATEAVFFS